MQTVDIILTGVALAMDAFALTIANCATYRNDLNKLKEWSMPVAFAIFQILMPIIGFYIGSVFAGYLKTFAGYIAASVFFILSAKIVFDNVEEIKKRKKGEEETTSSSKFSFWVLIAQAVATSIDALIIGAGDFAFSLSSPFIASLIVGEITFVIVTAALLFGKYMGNLFGKYAEWAGAVILFALAVKNLVTAIIG